MELVESLFLDASRAIDEREYSKAKEILEEILMTDPAYARAHNHMGWIYETKFKDFDKAKMHYELAIKFGGKSYPVAYVNYAYTLIDSGYYTKAWEIIEEALKVKGADTATLTYQKGKIAEFQKNYRLAYGFYSLAIRRSANNDFCEMVQKNVKRLRTKVPFYLRIFWK